MTLLQFDEQVVNDFLIPSFTISQGEIVIIKLPNGPFFYPVTVALSNILTQQVFNDHVKFTSAFKYVEHLKESRFRQRFFPISVGSYHKKYANPANPIYKKIYETSWITPKTKVKTLAGNPRKWLSLYTTLSWNNNIVFDLVAVDPQGGRDIYAFVKTMVNSGGAAILIDHFFEFKNDCTTFIEAEYIGDIPMQPEEDSH
jgi:hypothetical protein